jgi:hypothetical protein
VVPVSECIVTWSSVLRGLQVIAQPAPPRPSSCNTPLAFPTPSLSLLHTETIGTGHDDVGVALAKVDGAIAERHVTLELADIESLLVTVLRINRTAQDTATPCLHDYLSQLSRGQFH